MEFFNLLNVDPSAALSMKDRYEKALRAACKLDDDATFTFDSMFKQINLTDSILVDQDGKIIPFSIQDITPDFCVTFFTADSNETLKSFLEQIDYDLSSLKQVSNDEVMQMDLLESGTPYVVMDSKTFIIANK